MSPGYLAAPGIGNANGILLSFRSENGRIGTSNWGLFVSRGIVTDHGGRIEIESEEGKGTIGRIRLPVTPHAVVV